MLRVVFYSWFVFSILTSCQPHNSIEGDVIHDPRIDGFEEPVSGWKPFKHNRVDIQYALDSNKVKEGKGSLKIDYSFRDNDQMFVAFLVKDLGRVQDWSNFGSIGLWSFVPKKARDLIDLSVMVYEEDGSAFIAQNVRDLRKTGWESARVSFSKFVYSSGGKSKNRNSKPNFSQIRKVSVGIYQPVPFKDDSFSIYIDDFRLFSGEKQIVSQRSGNVPPAGKEKLATSPLVDNFGSGLSGWSKNVAKTVKIDYAIDGSVQKEGKGSLKLSYQFKKKKAFWGYLIKDLSVTRDWRSYDSLSFNSYIPKAAGDLVELSVMLYEEDGSAFITQHTRGLKTTGWKEITVPFSKFYPAGEWTKDENDKLDLDQVRKIAFGIWQPGNFSDKQFVFYINNIRAVESLSGVVAGAKRQAGHIVRTNELQLHEPPDGKVYHGVAAFSAPMKGWGKKRSDWEKQFDTKHISEYEKLSGKDVVIVSFFWFLDWEFPMKMCRQISKLGKGPHVGVISGGVKPSDIVNGKWDSKITTWAKAAKEYGKPIFLRLFPEMNGNWHLYSEAKNPSQTSQLFVKAWRRIVKISRKTGASNIIWVWAPTAVDVGGIHWADYYPGDEYVDWVGVSVYNFLGSGDPESQIMDIYNDYADRKPIIIAESGAGDADGKAKKYRPGTRYFDNPEKWIQRYFDTLEKKAPRVKAFVWFNIDRERVWHIQESPSKIKVYKNRLRNKRYGAKFK
jgi:hypothetical protein